MCTVNVLLLLTQTQITTNNTWTKTVNTHTNKETNHLSMRIHEITKSSAEQLVPVITMHASMSPSSEHLLKPSQV